MKIVIVGAVAGGASAAARARRLNEEAEIILIERGAEPSFANCGLPYYVGGEIEIRDKLLVAPAAQLRQRHRLDVRTRQEVTYINRDSQSITVRNLETGESYTETYDRLIISTGASPFRPPIPGIDSPHVLELRDLTDADRMHELVTTGGSRRAVIVGAGFIGIEVAENLVRRGLNVTVVELVDQILPPWDAEMVRPLEDHLREQGVSLRLNDSAEAFEDNPTADGNLTVRLKSGASIPACFAVVCIGVRPESKLAADAGIECGPRGGIITNDHMQTNDPHIYAVGDVAQVKDFLTGEPTQIPLAGPANRQGRIAADHIFGRNSTYRGTQGTAVVGVFGKTAAMTGHSEKLLRRANRSHRKIYIHPNDHAGYYPGASQMTLKLLFNPEDGRIWGAQAVGKNGVDKRIDVIAMAIHGGMTVYDLEEVELCYAPQYGSAKDPVNMAGFVASGVLRGDHPVTHVPELQSPPKSPDWFVLDVRTQREFDAGNIGDATNIPLEELRERLAEIPQDRRIAVYCFVGQRGYMATRLLKHNGFDVFNLSGGYRTWQQHHSTETES
ncbi:FAD-dependent oxidoreductase [Fuerstiella marisgermanici]|uniref:Coenzyme A disulfide reductase n=1 Tax=Fuerstiella marisgermanici TaxID=1891926 RepID=A0A1P8W9G7_9PLAN|nr:FAD-dependent oxidoreductase [Fuerstiella marisgermanici]APZ90707.1 Coenzyme A disulfide reductase [Fuerstiella marisgermanici]